MGGRISSVYASIQLQSLCCPGTWSFYVVWEMIQNEPISVIINFSTESLYWNVCAVVAGVHWLMCSRFGHYYDKTFGIESIKSMKIVFSIPQANQTHTHTQLINIGQTSPPTERLCSIEKQFCGFGRIIGPRRC